MVMTQPTEVDAFLETMLPRQLDAERALCGGDAGARRGTWSPNDPVTLFGAAVPLRRGREEVDETFHWLADRFSGARLQDYDFELVAAGASGDLAYTAGFERKTFLVDGEPVSYTLRVTHVYRREAGTWRIVHRHGDHPPGAADTAAPLLDRP
jgi:ketosteroid isomerase-like protein